MRWDAEARERAYAAAVEMAEFDPEGASEMLAHLEAQARAAEVPGAAPPPADAEEEGEDASGRVTGPGDTGGPNAGWRPYDPMELYARLAKYYGFSDEAMERMHHKRLFGYLREMNLQLEEQNEAQRRAERNARAGGSSSSAYNAVGDSPAEDVEALREMALTPRRWEGARDGVPEVGEALRP